MATFTNGNEYLEHLTALRKEEQRRVANLVENKIDEIHDMLIDYMDETAAVPILNKIHDLAVNAGLHGYQGDAT